MRLDIHGSHTQEDVEWQHGEEQLAVSAVPGKEHTDGTYAHVRTREGGGRSLSCFLGILYELVENSVGIAWGWQTVGMGTEVIAHCREDTLGNILHSHGIEVERWSHHRHVNVDEIVDEEAGEHHKAHSFSLVVSAEEIVEYYRCYHRIIHEVSHRHQFTHHRPGQCLGKEQGGLASKEILFPSRKEMVEVGEHAVDLVSIWIPPGKQGNLRNDAYHLRYPAWNHAIYAPKGEGHDQNSQSAPKHRLRIHHLGKGKEHGEDCYRHIAQHHPFQWQESLLGVLFYLKIIFYHGVTLNFEI